MGDQVDNTSLKLKTSDMATLSLSINRKMPKIHIVAPRKSFGQVVLLKNGRDFIWDSTMFLLKVGILEIVRRFSNAKRPFVWSGIQMLQALCYPPLNWLKRWGPFEGLVNGMQMLSKPLMVLSIATAFSGQSDHNNFISDTIHESHVPNNSQESSQANTERPCIQLTQGARISSVPDPALVSQPSTNWLFQLYTELENQGMKLPERLNNDELHRFYKAASGDLQYFMSSVKKTIQWRETYKILSGQELEMWSQLVFWHGFDVKNRHCLFVRLGLACTKLSPGERSRFVQAVVSQVEHGILHQVDPDNPQICVLMDCDGLSPLGAPIQMLRTCITILQEHFPERLALLLIIRLPPFVRVISQTFIQVLSPSTREKLKIYGNMYQQFLTENIQSLPSYLGSSCTCSICSKPNNFKTQIPEINRRHGTESKPDFLVSEYLTLTHTNDEKDKHKCQHVLRNAVVSMLVFWVLIVLVTVIYDLESLSKFYLCEVEDTVDNFKF